MQVCWDLVDIFHLFFLYLSLTQNNKQQQLALFAQQTRAKKPDYTFTTSTCNSHNKRMNDLINSNDLEGAAVFIQSSALK